MSGTKVRFLNATEIEQAIRDASSVSRAQRIDIALAGGAAMQLFGSDRLTKDVGFVSSAVPDGIRVKKQLSFGGISGETESGTPVDFIVRDDDYEPLYEEALAKAMAFEDLPVKVVRPEYLAAMKLAARRVKDEEDLRALIASGNVNIAAARVVVAAHLGRYAVDEFDSYVDEVTWRKSRGEM